MLKNAVILFIVYQIIGCGMFSGDTFDVPNALKGTVVDSDGTGVAGNSVELISVRMTTKGDSVTVEYRTTCDEKGTFEIKEYDDESYTLYSYGKDNSGLDARQLTANSDNCIITVSNRVALKGRVTGDTKNVKVSLVGQKNVTTLDEKGFYTFGSISKGNYDIAFIRDGRIDYLQLNTVHSTKDTIYIRDVYLSEKSVNTYSAYESELTGYTVTSVVYPEENEPTWYSDVEFEDIYSTEPDSADESQYEATDTAKTNAFYTYIGTGYETAVFGFATYFARETATATGGDTAVFTVVTDEAALTAALTATDSSVVLISGEITLATRGMLDVTSNKTIIGATTDAAILNGGLRIMDASNVIIKNIRIAESADDTIWDDANNSTDGIQIRNADHVWIDHCTFDKIGDGAIDVTYNSSYITISNSLFEETCDVILIGNDNDEVTTDDDYNVTVARNHFLGTLQGHARARFGKIHIYNNFYDSLSSYNKSIGIDGDGYGIGIGVDVEILSEENLFVGVVKCSKDYDSDTQNGILVDIGSELIDSKQFEQDTVDIWDPLDYYDYSAIDALEVEQASTGFGSGMYYIEVTSYK